MANEEARRLARLRLRLADRQRERRKKAAVAALLRNDMAEYGRLRPAMMAADLRWMRAIDRIRATH
jgi:hypothetical protein